MENVDGLCDSKVFEVSQEGTRRCLKAIKNLEVDDFIFSETPIVFGPRTQRLTMGSFPCVGCSKIIDETNCDFCESCSWPVCNKNCTGLTIHSIHGFECKILAIHPRSELTSFFDHFRFDILSVIRMLSFQQTCPEKWQEILNLVDNGVKEDIQGTEKFKIIEEKIRHLQQKYLTEVSQELLHQLFGILDRNSIEISDEFDVVLLYTTASLLENNCTPNTYQTINNSDSFKIIVKTATPIKQSEKITTISTNILWGTYSRREHLKQTKYFSCTCKRCKDPSELGTFLSALKCLGTEKNPCGGLQLPLDPLNSTTMWICNKCGINLPNSDVMKFVNHLSKEVDKFLSRQPNFYEMDNFLQKLLNFLHFNHYLIYSIKHTLIQLKGDQTNNDHEISNEFLEKKLQMCEELIGITRKIDPGNSRLTLYLAVLLNEMFFAKFNLVVRKFDSNRLPEFLEELKGIKTILGENQMILKRNSEGKSGEKLLLIVEENEKKFLNWLELNGTTL